MAAIPISTVEEMLRLALKGDLWDADQAWDAEQAADGCGTPEEFANALIAAKLATRYQAQQLLHGRYRGFALADYKLLHIAGVGATGKVFLAERQSTGGFVALKAMTDDAAGSAAERFAREARAGSSLKHPNLVQTLDFGRHKGRPFLTMEYVDGHNLHAWVRRHGPMPWPQACDIVRQAAAGLAFAAQNGIFHRDVKPSNLMLARTGVVKLLDMGLARVLAEETAGREPLSMRYDERALGSADYVAPEQIVDSHAVDGKADIYGLGLTLHFLLTGHTAAPDGTIATKLTWHASAAPARLREWRPDVPVEVQATLDWMIAKKPAARIDAHRVRERLAPFAQESRTQPRRSLKAAIHTPLDADPVYPSDPAPLNARGT